MASEDVIQWGIRPGRGDGSILAGGGSTVKGQNAQLATAALTSGGLLDTRWGGTGKILKPISMNSAGYYTLRAFPGGWIYASGHAKTSGSVGSLLLARLLGIGPMTVF